MKCYQKVIVWCIIKCFLLAHCIQIAYHGIPDKVYEVFLEAYQASSLLHTKEQEAMETKNPAGESGGEVKGVCACVCVCTRACARTCEI